MLRRVVSVTKALEKVPALYILNNSQVAENQHRLIQVGDGEYIQTWNIIVTATI